MAMLNVPAKAVRAAMIRSHLRDAGLPPRVVCCTCGNAARELRAIGLEVIEIGPKGVLSPNRWLSHADIAKAWPSVFDATSGHLPVWFMQKIGAALRQRIGDTPPSLRVPSGSGETAVCLALAYPHLRFTAVYDSANPATTYSPHAPLNGLVRALCAVDYAPDLSG